MLDRRRVLIVWNQKTSYNRCKMVLEENEVAYDIAPTTEEALELLLDRSYEAVVLYDQTTRDELLEKMEEEKLCKPVMLYSDEEIPIKKDSSLVVQSSKIWNRQEFQKFLNSFV